MGSAFKDFETLQAAFAKEGLELPPVLTAALDTYKEALTMRLAEEHKGDGGVNGCGTGSKNLNIQPMVDKLVDG
eukprot:Skav233255  [mRNA]  locus=scaffold2371:55384:55879:- [translate_table: standard]